MFKLLDKKIITIFRSFFLLNWPYELEKPQYCPHPQKSYLFQYSLIAAYLDPRDEDEWVRLADLTMEQNNVDQAIKCYTNGMYHVIISRCMTK